MDEGRGEASDFLTPVPVLSPNNITKLRPVVGGFKPTVTFSHLREGASPAVYPLEELGQAPR